MVITARDARLIYLEQKGHLEGVCNEITFRASNGFRMALVKKDSNLVHDLEELGYEVSFKGEWMEITW